MKLEKLQKQIYEDADLKKVMDGDNTDTNKKEAFNKALESQLIGLVGENLDFYNRFSEPKANRFLKDMMFVRYARSAENASA